MKDCVGKNSLLYGKNWGKVERGAIVDVHDGKLVYM